MKPTLPEPTIVSYQTNSAMRTMEVRSYSSHEVQRLIDEAYVAGLEDAAKACESLYEDQRNISDYKQGKNNMTEECASAIRALKGK